MYNILLLLYSLNLKLIAFKFVKLLIFIYYNYNFKGVRKLSGPDLYICKLRPAPPLFFPEMNKLPIYLLIRNWLLAT